MKCVVCANTFTTTIAAELLEYQPFGWEPMGRCPRCGAVTAIVLVAATARSRLPKPAPKMPL